MALGVTVMSALTLSDRIFRNVIDGIFKIENGLDFFDYSFVLNLVDLYAEEIPETAERIEMKEFSLRSIAIEFLGFTSSIQRDLSTKLLKSSGNLSEMGM